jgi:phage repressor protein C with HTH and peptisase S24 domain
MKKSETIHDRISQLVDYFGDNKNTVFAKLVGESEANVRGYKVNVVPKHPFLEKIVRNLDVSPRWLLTGEGEMLSSEQPASEPTPAVVYERDPRDIELIATQRQLLNAYQQGYGSGGLGSGASSAPTAGYPYTGPQHPRK